MDDRSISWWARIKLALRLLLDGAAAARALAVLDEGVAEQAPKPPEKLHAAALFLLAALQREGRFIDFVQQEMTGFSDEEIGVAARVVHAGCRKLLSQYLEVQPVLTEAEGQSITVPAGFDAQRIRLTGNVRGNAPFHGALKHHGWVTQAVHFPEVQASLDARVLMPAEVEIGT